MYVFPMPNSHSCPRHQNQKKVKKEAKSQKNHQNRTSPRLVPKVVQNKAFGEGTKRALTKWCEFGIKNWSKKTLSIIKKWWETSYDFKNSAFRWQWFFWPTLAEWYILLYDLHQFLKSKSFKRGSRNAAAVQNVQSYPSEKQNYQNALIYRWHAKVKFLTTNPGRKRNPCLPLRAMDFPKLYVLKHLVKKSHDRWNFLKK